MNKDMYLTVSLVKHGEFPLSCCLLLNAGDFWDYIPTKHVVLVFWRISWVHDFVKTINH